MLKRRLGAIVAVAGFVLVLAGNGVVSPSTLSLVPTATQLGTQQLNTPTMQPVNTPARPVRVAVVPGTGGAEAWAIAYSSALVPGWTPGGLGQTVLLHYTKVTGWQLAGPPLNSDGSPSTARLSAIAIAPGGEGWAVGQSGAMVHHAAGDGLAWRVVKSQTSLPLNAISLTPSGANGFAVGDYDSANHRLNVLMLSGGQWSRDTAADGSTATNLDLSAVSAVSDSEAWAVSGDTSQSLYIVHRTTSSVTPAWQRVQTTSSMFDSPTGNQAANGGGVTAGNGGAWVVGRMQSSDATHPLGDSQAGDTSRPFAVSLVGSGTSYTAHTYCPGIMTVQSGNTQSPQQNGQATYSNVCQDDFPLAAFGLTGIASFGDVGSGEAFAGGMGLFHFVQVGGKGTWEREPDPVGFLSSLSMSAPDEGWMTGTGSNAITGAALGESMAIGHWTKHPQVPALARWPEPGTTPLEGVALDPGGSGTALAVGNGQRARYVPGFGWEVLTPSVAQLHAIAWPATNNGWAVGTAGVLSHWDGYAWSDGRAPRNHATDPMSTLYGVAFSDAGHGWAVGGGGMLLDYAGGKWRRDGQSSTLTKQPLYAVAAAGGVAVAGGAGGTILVNQGGSWQIDTAASALAQAGTPSAATIYAAASLPNGTLALAGSNGLVLVRQPGRPFAQVGSDQGWTTDGTVIALALSRSASGTPEIFASVSPHSNTKYIDGTLATTDGYLFAGDASSDWSNVQWHDIELNDQATMWTSTDTAAAHDPVYAIAIAPGTLHGWAVGGYPSLTIDDTNQSNVRQTSSGSVYRVDLAGDPSPPSSLTQLPSPPSSGYTFAFLGDSACSAGICGAALGTGATADTVLQEAQREIEMVNPAFTVFGGNMRGTGYPSELSVFKRYMQNWTMPVVAALGDADVASALNPSNVAPGAPSPSGVAPGTAPSQADFNGVTTNTPYLNLFNDEPSPWGHGQDTQHLYSGLTGADVSVDTAPNAGEANNHYAFDFQPQGLPAQVRFIVLDDSTGSLSSSKDNPPETAGNTQVNWYESELADAQKRKLQTIVIMNTPSDDPRSVAPGTGLTAPDGTTFDRDASMNDVSAVFASHINGNMQATISTPGGASVPLYVSGGAGSPLEGSRNSLHGYYHSWLLVTVDPDHPNPLTHQATVTVAAMPVIESVAMKIDTPTPEAGVLAGHASQVYGLGRLPDSGIGNLNGPNPDATQSRADYVQFPPAFYGAGNCLPSAAGQPGTGEQDTCSEPYALNPYHRFWSENQNIAAFVKPCGLAYAPYGPCIDGSGKLIPDQRGQWGYLCAIKPGKVWIDVLLGIHVARELVTVNPGAGPCNEHPLPQPPPVVPKTVPPAQPAVVQPNVQPVVAPQQPRPLVPARHPHLFHQFNTNLVPAVLPPPVPVLAAAPPLPAAGTAAKKEEKREHAIEHSQESGGAQGHKAVIRSDADAYWDPRPAAVGGTAALLMLILLTTWSAARREPSAVIDRRRWE